MLNIILNIKLNKYVIFGGGGRASWIGQRRRTGVWDGSRVSQWRQEIQEISNVKFIWQTLVWIFFFSLSSVVNYPLKHTTLLKIIENFSLAGVPILDHTGWQAHTLAHIHWIHHHWNCTFLASGLLNTLQLYPPPPKSQYFLFFIVNVRNYFVRSHCKDV